MLGTRAYTSASRTKYLTKKILRHERHFTGVSIDFDEHMRRRNTRYQAMLLKLWGPLSGEDIERLKDAAHEA